MNICALLLAVNLAALCSVLSLPMKLDRSMNMDNLLPIPQLDGSVRWMTSSEAMQEDISDDPIFNNNSRNMDKVRFFLFTQDNPTEHLEVDKDDPETLVRSTFNFKNPTRLMIHGWDSGYGSEKNRWIREALLLNGHKRQLNFFVVDWSVYSNSPTYIKSQKSCSKTGKIIAEFLDWMHDNAKLSFETLALYGHSLGAHVAGFAGKNVKRGIIDTIVGLDAAMPLFRFNKPKTRLCDTDARYVETIHTNGGVLGFLQPLGRAAFYPNGGQQQPECGSNIFCSHQRSVEYFAEALRSENNNPFKSNKCIDYKNFSNTTCNFRTAKIRMGDPSNAIFVQGIFYLETNIKLPYGVREGRARKNHH